MASIQLQARKEGIVVVAVLGCRHYESLPCLTYEQVMAAIEVHRKRHGNMTVLTTSSVVWPEKDLPKPVKKLCERFWQ